jgi:drug/metabolite transporter (DMT)-like permease
MKQQVARLSPHQNGKVFGVLMALLSLVFVVPFSLSFAFAPSDPNAPPAWLFMLFPLLYLVMGYLTVAVACWLYNVMFKHIGGIEYEATSGEA